MREEPDTRDEGVCAAPASAAQARLGSDVLTVVLVALLWFALGSLVVVLVAGLGAHPGRRLAIGAAMVLLSALALARRRAVAAALRSRPWLVFPLCAAALSASLLDGLVNGPYVSLSTASLAVTVVVARTRTVWACVASLELVYVSAVLASHSPASLVRDGDLDGVLGAVLGYPVVALVGLGLVRLFARFAVTAEPHLDALRGGSPALTPALTLAIERGAATPRALLAPPSPSIALTAAERRVVDALASGRSPKELAHLWGLSLATVRTHIRNAKRKTGARTLRELAAWTARAPREGGPA